MGKLTGQKFNAQPRRKFHPTFAGIVSRDDCHRAGGEERSRSRRKNRAIGTVTDIKERKVALTLSEWGIAR